MLIILFITIKSILVKLRKASCAHKIFFTESIMGRSLVIPSLGSHLGNAQKLK